jgi:hypothetical protein
MIYVEEKDFNRQLELLSFLATSLDLNICAWLYPESTAKELAGIAVTNNPLSLSPVTTYENGFSPKCTSPTAATKSTLDSFGSSHTELKKNCDSLALYKNNQSSWLATTIGHEGMCLVQDESLLTSLTQAGFSATTSAPDWW